MAETTDYFRSPELMDPKHTALVVIDVQERLLPVIDRWERVQRNVGRLIEGAEALGIPVFLTEQYPRGLGKTVADVEARFAHGPTARVEKKSFSCCGVNEFCASLGQYSLGNLVLCGIESHVCVFQSAMDLLAKGYRVFVVADAVGSRHSEDLEISLRRLESQGVSLTSTEMTLFEWCETADNPVFKTIQTLIRDH